MVVDAENAMRDAEIRALQLIGRPMPDVLQHLVRVATQVSGAAVAEIHVITSTAQHTLASTGEMPDPWPASDSYCARIVRERERNHVIPDVRRDERFKDSTFTTSGAVRTYAASQLVTGSGVPIGTLCIFDSDERAVEPETMEVIAELARAAGDVLEARRQHEEVQGSLADMTDRQRELRRSNEHLAAFAGQVSHDIQGPLATVVMALQLLDEDLQEEAVAVPEHRRMFLQNALSGAQRMRSTVTGLMDFAVVGGRLTRVRLQMNGVVQDVLHDLSARMGRTSVQVDELPAVWGDDVQIRAVTQNLIANAVKYAGHVEEPVIRISGHDAGDRARICVSDNGPGVAPHQRESIFALLVRGEGAAQSGVEGLGIGLATCRRILQSHGGQIGVCESESGGAEFWFELPVCEPDVN